MNSDFVGPWTGTNALPDAIVDGAPPRFDGAYRASFADSQHMARWGWQLHMARWDVAPEVKSRQPALLIVALPRRVRDRQAGRGPARGRARDRARVRRHPGVDPRRVHADDPVAGHRHARRHGAEASWPRAYGATGYTLYRRDVTAGETKATAYPYAVGAQSWTEKVLPAGHKFEFSIRALRGNRSGAQSAPGSNTVKPLPVVPNVRATTSASSPYAATVSWDPVAEADDYAVYAYFQNSGECFNGIGPRPESMQLVQWGLGGKTSWTQTYIVDAICVHYRVVAMRYGGEGAHAAGNTVATAFPYANNLFHWQARAKFWSGDVWPGDKRLTTNVGAGPDNGIVFVRAFIQNTPDIEGMTVSDNRSYSSDPLASSRATVAWDTGTGDVSVYVQQSCFWSGCVPAFPISLVSDAASIGDSNRDNVNYVTVRRSGNGLEVGTSAVISFDGLLPSGAPPTPRINARISLVPSGDTYRRDRHRRQVPVLGDPPLPDERAGLRRAIRQLAHDRHPHPDQPDRAVGPVVDVHESRGRERRRAAGR